MDSNKQDNPMNDIVNAAAMEVLRALAINETKTELEGKLNSVLKVIAGLKDDLVKNATDMNNATTTQLYDSLLGVERQLKSLITESEDRAVKKIEDVGNELRVEIAQVDAKIIPAETITRLDDKIDGLDILTMAEVEAELPKFGMAFRDGLELLQGDDRLDKSAIKGLEEALKRLEKMIGRSAIVAGGGGRAGATSVKDLSAQTNGSLKVFTVPKNTWGILIGTDFPTVLMENNGFTINSTRTQITITTTNAPSNQSQLAFMYRSIFNT